MLMNIVKNSTGNCPGWCLNMPFCWSNHCKWCTELVTVSLVPFSKKCNLKIVSTSVEQQLICV